MFIAGRATTPTRKQIKRLSEDVRGLNDQMSLHSSNPLKQGYTMKKNLELESPQRFECLGQEWVMYEECGRIRIEPDLDPDKHVRIPFIQVSWDQDDEKYAVWLGMWELDGVDLFWYSSLYRDRSYETLKKTDHTSSPSGWFSDKDVKTVPDLVGQYMKKVVNEIDPPVERFSGEELIPDFCEEMS